MTLPGRIVNLLRHGWMDASDSRRLLPDDAMRRLAQHVSASERRHTGEIRVVVESGLPLSYLWRHCLRGTDMATLARQRATMLFGKLRVWDTEHNNGVLVYLLLAERRIELLADRGVDRHVGADQWAQMVARMARKFADGRFEEGLLQALDEVESVLLRHFRQAADMPVRLNELPDDPLRV